MSNWTKWIKTGFVFVSVLAIGLTACQSQEATSTPLSAEPSASDYRIEPIEVDTVEVKASADKPQQLEVHVKGMLGDGCAEFNSVEQRQDGNTIELTITRRQALGQPCPEIAVMYDEVIPLEGELTQEAYTLKVNDVEKSIEMDEFKSAWEETEEKRVEEPEEIIKIARRLLAEDIGVEADQLDVVSVKPVQWRNSSLGCPQKGMNYLDVITPGYQVKLRAGDTYYYVHTNENGDQALVCHDETEKADQAESIETDLSVEVKAAATDLLATELGVAAADVRVVSAEFVQWRDSSLGCPQPGEGYLQVITPGYRIELKADGSTHYVHTNQDGSQAVLCDQQMDTPGGAEAPEEVLKAATDLLTEELAVSAENVTVVSAEFVQWRDSSLGCPQPGMAYLQVITPGYRVKLEMDGAEYFVHTNQDGSQTIVCKQEVQ